MRPVLEKQDFLRAAAFNRGHRDAPASRSSRGKTQKDHHGEEGAGGGGAESAGEGGGLLKGGSGVVDTGALCGGPKSNPIEYVERKTS